MGFTSLPLLCFHITKLTTHKFIYTTTSLNCKMNVGCTHSYNDTHISEIDPYKVLANLSQGVTRPQEGSIVKRLNWSNIVTV